MISIHKYSIVQSVLGVRVTVLFYTGPSIFIILNGSGVITCGSSKDILQKGVTIFLPASCPEVKLIPDQSLDNEMLLFQAFCSI